MRWRTLLIGSAVALLLVLAIGTVTVVGELASLPSGDHPDVDFEGREITAARNAALPELEGQLDAVERRAGIEHVGQRGRRDRCEAGQDNFTRQDTYAYVCRLQIVQVMPVGRPFEVHASLLGEALLEGDCPDGTDTDRTLAEPYDDPQDLNSSSGDCYPGYYDPAPRIDFWLHARPSPDQLRRATFRLPSPCRPARRGEYCTEVPLNLRAAVAAAPPDAVYLAVVVAGEFDTYYEIEWE